MTNYFTTILLNFLILISFYLSLSRGQMYIEQEHQSTFKISYDKIEVSYQIDALKSVDSFLEVNLEIQENLVLKDYFNCFFVSLNRIEHLIPQEISSSLSTSIHNDLQSCLLKEKDQVIYLPIHNIQEIFIYSYFYNDNGKIIPLRQEQLESIASIKYIPKTQFCNHICTGGICNNEYLQAIDLKCVTCNQDKGGKSCDMKVKSLEVNSFIAEGNQILLKSQSWNFFSFQINTLSRDQQNNEDSLNNYSNFYLLLQFNLKQQNEFQIYQSYSIYQDPTIDNKILPNFIGAQKISMLSLNEEQLQKQNKFLTNWTIILGIFNLDNQDVEGNILFLDELTRINFKSVHEIELSNMQTIWLGGIGLLLFGSMISLGLIIAKKNQIATIISKKQQEKLEKLSEQVIDKYLIKYTFKHILKAVQKKKREICTQLKNSATQESIILNKLKGRCDSILQSEECGICMCSFENDELCRLIMCDHVFHAKCIDEWAIRNQNCPFCRTELSEQAMAIWKESQKGYPYPLDQSLHSSQFETDQSFKQKNESEQKQQEVSIRIGQRKYIDKDFILNNKKNDKDDDCYNLYNIDPQNEQAKNNISTFENKEPISPFKVFDTQRILPDQEDMQSIKTIKTQVIIEDKAEGSIQNILDLNTQSNSKKEHLQKVNGKSELRLKNNIFSKRPSKSQLISSTLTYCLPNSQSQTHRNSIQKLLSNAKADQQEQQE